MKPYFVFALALTGCALFPPLPETMPLHAEPEAMHAEVLRYVPIGAPVEEAKAKMVKHGFRSAADKDSGNALWKVAEDRGRMLVFRRGGPNSPRPEDRDMLPVEVWLWHKKGCVTFVRVEVKRCQL
jgi:hypothetical protein